MGGCFSGDLDGGKQAIGGVLQRPTSMDNNAAHNDAVDFFFRSRGQFPLFSQIELSLSASNLIDRDITSKVASNLISASISNAGCPVLIMENQIICWNNLDADLGHMSDPMAVMYLRKRDGVLEEIGRTEVILNNLNPNWIEKITINFHFESVQTLVFRVYDVDTSYHNIPVKTLKLKDQEFLGEATCVLSEIMTRPNRTVTLSLDCNLGPSGRRQTLAIHAEETAASKSVVEMDFHCTKLDNKDLFSKSDPFLRISRVIEAGGTVPICRTEVVDDNLNPVWKPLCLSMQQFGSKENPLVIECFDFNSSGDHELIGKMQKSVAELENLNREKCGANFIYPSIHNGAEKILKGQLFVDRFVENVQYSFLDYISSGFELNFMVAVDFTASNGDPRMPSSLHYIDPSGRLNSYQQAIIDVGEVIQFYDSDRQFPAWGFGGRTFNGSVSHCFNLNGTPDGYEVAGVDGIMAAYATALHNVSLAGPTLFGPVVDKAAHIASQSISQNTRKYFVLLIITDGVLSDMRETKDALVRASDLPLSILIVGVGNADFKQMEFLDSDDGRRLESSTGRIATRDIVQFVPMREVHSREILVVQSLLEELPSQFLTYFRTRNVNPVGAPAS